MISGRLTMRASIERDQNAAADDWGGAGVPDMQPVGDPLPCFVYSKTSRELADGAKTALIEDLRAMFQLDADVLAGDEIVSVTDRKGTVLISGRLKIEGPVQHKHTHVEASLQRIG